MTLWDEKIASSQITYLLITIVSSTSFLFVPAITSEMASNDGWMSVLFGATAFGVVVALVCSKLGLYFPSQSIVEYAPVLVGNLAGKLIGLMYGLFFIHINAMIVREFGDFLITAFLPETPMIVFNITVIILAASIVRHGLEVLARINQFIFPMFLFVLAGIVIFTIDVMNLANLLPILELGIKPVLAGSITPSAWRGEVAIILMLLPYLNKPKEVRKSVIMAVLAIAVILTLPTLAGFLVFGADQYAHYVFPTLQLARYISIGDFIERIEGLIIIVWVAGITIKVSAFYLASVLAIAQSLNVENYRPLVLPIGIVTLVYSIVLFANSREIVHFFATVFPFYAYIFELFIPAVLLVIALIRKKGVQGR